MFPLGVASNVVAPIIYYMYSSYEVPISIIHTKNYIVFLLDHFKVFMIELTSLKDEKIIVNADQIAFVERLGDTMVTMTNGHRIRVLEKPEDVIELTLRWQQKKWLPLIS